MSDLLMALVHLNVIPEEVERNRRNLLDLIRRAGKEGARIIVSPELSLSGYSFKSREEIVPFTETEEGETIRDVAAVTKELNIYACIGLAERDPETNILYNSVFAIGPRGDILCRYRKINAESRWACPGDARQNNTFDTPWGKVGLLICADSYHGLMARATALRGADLLIIPANWPASGLDPRELWKGRALENGFFLAACNRTGCDKIMDCRHAFSCVYDPSGEILLEKSKEDTDVFYVNLPLESNGKLNRKLRREIMSRRKVHKYHDCYLNLRLIRDITSFYGLPKPEPVNLWCAVPKNPADPIEDLKKVLPEHPSGEQFIYMVPPCHDGVLEFLASRIKGQKVFVISKHCHEDTVYLILHGESSRMVKLETSKDYNVSYLLGSVRVEFCSFESLAHPEEAYAAAKRGTDLIVSCEEKLPEHYDLLGGIRTIENVSIVLCGNNGGGIWFPPEGHNRWQESLAVPGKPCYMRLDIAKLREKRFQDAVDFDVLLASNNTYSE